MDAWKKILIERSRQNAIEAHAKRQAAKVARAEKALIKLLYTPKRDWRSRDWI